MADQAGLNSAGGRKEDMPYNPQITYQTGALAEGISEGTRGLVEGMKLYAQNKQEHSALSDSAEQLAMFRAKQGLGPVDPTVLKKFGSGGLASKRALLGQVMAQTNMELRQKEEADKRALEKLQLEELRRKSALGITEEGRRESFRQQLLREIENPKAAGAGAVNAPTALQNMDAFNGNEVEGGWLTTDSPPAFRKSAPPVGSLRRPEAIPGLLAPGFAAGLKTLPDDFAREPSRAPAPTSQMDAFRQADTAVPESRLSINPEMLRRIAARTQVDPKWAAEYLGWYDPNVTREESPWRSFTHPQTGQAFVSRGNTVFPAGNTRAGIIPEISGMRVVKITYDSKGNALPIYERIPGAPDTWIKTRARGIWFDPATGETIRERTPGQFEVVMEWEKRDGAKAVAPPAAGNSKITKQFVRDADGNLIQQAVPAH